VSVGLGPLLALAGVVGAGLGGPVALPQREPPPRVEVDPFDRSIERLRYECYNTLGRREITLFANGTIRLRDGLKATPTLSLGELTRDELNATVKQLSEIDFSETEISTQGVSGEWVEHCRLQLDLPNDRERVFSFSRFDTRPPAVERLVNLAEALVVRVQPTGRAQHLPTGYVPLAGDVLRRLDGLHFRILGDTADRAGVELDCIDAPLRMYTPKGGLGLEFDRLISRTDRRGIDQPYVEEQ